MQIPQGARKFIDGLCGLDIDAIQQALSDDARISVGGDFVAAGRTPIRNLLIRAMSLVFAIQCEPAVVWMRRDLAIIEADVTCERLDQAQVSFPVTMILRFRDERISDLRLLTYEPALVGHFSPLLRTTGASNRDSTGRRDTGVLPSMRRRKDALPNSPAANDNAARPGSSSR